MCCHQNCDPVPMSSLAPILKARLPEKHQDLIDLNPENFCKGAWSAVMRIYGDADRMKSFLKDFASFPGRDTYFGLELAEPMISPPLSLKNVCNQAEFIYKQFFFIHIQRFVTHLDLPFKQQNYFIHSVIGYYLKTKERDLKNTFELVPLCERLRLEASNKLQSATVLKVHKLGSEASYEDVFRKLKAILPPHPEDLEGKSLLKLVERTNKQKSIKNNISFYEDILNHIQCFVEALGGFIAKHPKLFLPRKAFELNYYATIRIFTDENFQYVMVHELINEMKYTRMDTKGLEEYENKPELWTVDLQTVISKLPCALRMRMNFIGYPFSRNPLTTIVPAFDGKYCVSTPTLLMEILTEMFIVYGCFQRLNQHHWKILEELFEKLLNRLTIESEGARFIYTDKAMTIKKWILTSVEEKLKQFPRIVKDVRLVRPSGFTLKDCKNEVTRLGLTETFGSSTVMKHVESMFSKLKSTKCDMDTTDMHALLKTVQRECLIEKLPSVLNFFHEHNSCDRFATVCKFCFKETYPSDVKPGGDKTEKKKEKKKRQAEKKKLAKEQSTSSEIVEDTPEEVPMKTETCSNCFQTSQLCESVKEKLREEKIKGKILTKELAEVKKKGSEMDKKMQFLEECLGEKSRKPTTLEAVLQKTEIPAQDKKIPCNNCEKCSRTIHFSEIAKEEFKQEKLKNKILRKEITEEKNREIQKDEQIQILEEKLALLETSSPIQRASESEESESDKVEPQPIRCATSMYPNSEFTPEALTKFNELLNLHNSIGRLQVKATQKAQKLMRKAKDESNLKTAGIELNLILKSFRRYQEGVEKNIEWIQCNKNSPVSQLPSLPEAPKFSKHFEEIYDEVVNEELKDQDCLVCLDELEDRKETVKCKKCRRRFHKKCAWEWVTMGEDKCPTCDGKLQF